MKAALYVHKAGSAAGLVRGGTGSAAHPGKDPALSTLGMPQPDRFGARAESEICRVDTGAGALPVSRCSHP